MLKKTIYLLSTMILLGTFSRFLYQRLMLSQDIEQVMLTIIVFLCIVGGYGLGQYRWRIVYIEKRKWKEHPFFKNKKKV